MTILKQDCVQNEHGEVEQRHGRNLTRWHSALMFAADSFRTAYEVCALIAGWRSVLRTLLMGLPLVAFGLHAQVLYTNSFSANVDYLTNGIVGTIWDGVYYGAHEFNNSGVGGGAPGKTVQCDANIGTAGALTLQTTGTAWEGADDDGFFLYKVVAGDFSLSVHVVSPFDATGYNTAGLMARAFGEGGDPPGGMENYVSWTRFDQYNFANYLRDEVNGSVTQINPGGYPNSNYWLRMDRVNGTNFLCYQKAVKNDAWQLVTFPSPVSGTVLRRPDFAGKPLQVGITHATFNDALLGVKFTDFSLSVSNNNPVAAPAAPTGLMLASNLVQGLDVSWTPGAGSAGSVVVMWQGTNRVVRQIPPNGFSYVGNATYGQGSMLPANGHRVVYAGSGNHVTVSGLTAGETYNVAVFSYAGAGGSISYNHTPATASLVVPLNQVWAQLGVQAGTVSLTFSANPGKWYWVEFTDSLNPAAWQNALPTPILASGPVVTVEGLDGGLATSRFYRLREVDSTFNTAVSSTGITSLRHTKSAEAAEFISGGKLGNVTLKYKPLGGGTWYSVDTATLNGVASSTYSITTNAEVIRHVYGYVITNGLSGAFRFESVLDFGQDTIQWTLNSTNLSGQSLVIGDLAVPFPMNTTYSSPSSSVFKHSFISGHGSWIFWMRPDSVGPYLTLTTADNTSLEYWDRLASGGAYEAYIHSAVIGQTAASQGTQWRQTNTSLTLLVGGAQTYGFNFRWADDYDAVRQALVDEGKIDINVVPGMTVPTNLFARFALRTT